MPRIQRSSSYIPFKADPKPLSVPAISRVLLNTISKYAQAFFFGFLLFSPASALTWENKVEVFEDPSLDSFRARMQPFQDNPQRELSFWNTYPGKVLTEGGDSACYLSYGFKTPEECSVRVNNYLSTGSSTVKDQKQHNRIEHVFHGGKGDIVLGINPQERESSFAASAYLQETLFGDHETIARISPEEFVEIIKTSHRILTNKVQDGGEFREGFMMIPGVEKGKPQTVDNLIEIVKLRRNCSEQECMQLRSIITKHLQSGNSCIDIYRRFSANEREIWHHHFGIFPLPEDIEEEMLQFAVEFKQRWPEIKTTDDAIDFSAWGHQKIVDIHGFSDANGRLARKWMIELLKSKGIKHIIFDNPGIYKASVSEDLRKNPGAFKKYLQQMIRWNQVMDPLNLNSKLIDFPDCSTSFSVDIYLKPPTGEVFVSPLKKRANTRVLARWTMEPGRIFDHTGDSACIFYERNPHRARTRNIFIAKAKETALSHLPEIVQKVEIPGKTTVFLGRDPIQLDNYEKTSEYLQRTFQQSLRELNSDEIAAKIKNAYRLLFQEDEWRTALLRNIETSEFKDYSVAEYTAYAKRRGASAIELGVLQDCLVKFNGRFEMQQYSTLTEKEQGVWNHYITRIPPPSEIESQIAVFAKDLKANLQEDDLNIVGLGAWCHQEILRISPCNKFQDNYKFARIIMNTVFQHFGYNPVIFPTEYEYIEAIQRDRRISGDFAVYLASMIRNNFALRFKTFA